jgi:hypothetical protein
MIFWNNLQADQPIYKGCTICWADPQHTIVKVFYHGHIRNVEVGPYDRIEFDATEEIFANVERYFYTGSIHSNKTHYLKRATAPAPGCSVLVARGRTPNKGKQGVVFATAERLYVAGWKQGKLGLKLGIALGQAIEITTSSFGRTLLTPADRIWEWAHNCDVVDAEFSINLRQMESYAREIAAKGVERLKLDMLESRSFCYGGNYGPNLESA